MFFAFDPVPIHVMCAPKMWRLRTWNIG